MTPRADTITAMRVDLTQILVLAIFWLEASCILAASGVPAEVAARMLAEPKLRRRLDLAPVER